MSVLTQKLDGYFRYSEKGSSFGTEIRAGLTTFAAMAYILPVNVDILGSAGLDAGAVFIATALSAVIGTLLMAFLAKLPLAQAPGMGLNAFFAFTVVIGMGYSPAFALAAVLTEGLIFIVLSLTGARTALFNAIPAELRIPISAGIGLFILFIGLQNANFIVDEPATLVTINTDLSGATVALAVIGIAVTIALWLRKVKGALLLGILITWGLGVIAQLTGWYVPNLDAGLPSLIPAGVAAAPPNLMPTLGLCFSGFRDAFSSLPSFGSFLVVVFTFLFVDIFDTMGALSGVATKTGLLDKDGKLAGVKGALTADAVATTAGALLGTSTVTTYAESYAGIEEGGRTGLTSIVTALCFVGSIFFYPVVGAIPTFATTCALVVVGIMAFEPMKNFDFSNPAALVPGVVTIAFMVLGYSISAGITWGILAFILTKLVLGRAKEISPLVWGLGVVFLVKIILLDRLV